MDRTIWEEKFKSWMDLLDLSHHLSHPAWCAGGDCPAGKTQNLKPGILGQTGTQKFWISALARDSTKAEKIFSAGEAAQSLKPGICV